VYTPSQTVKLRIVELGASFFEGLSIMAVELIPSNSTLSQLG